MPGKVSVASIRLNIASIRIRLTTNARFAIQPNQP